MTRILPISLAAMLLAAAVQAQTPAPPSTQEQPRPKPGTILATPSSGGRITPAPPQRLGQRVGPIRAPPQHPVRPVDRVPNVMVAGDPPRLGLQALAGEPY